MIIAESVIPAVSGCHGASRARPVRIRSSYVGVILFVVVCVVEECLAFAVATKGVQLGFHRLVLKFEVGKLLQKPGVGLLELGKLRLAICYSALYEHLCIL